ncbi:DUF2586 domain-containing protein [Methylomagnum ishizawai]|uniref:DUF2586 domain-containing protein n=1 Tax=Methylomagnum ishizawai TaxID=1760988 RepID=UPI001C3387C0|nr:DUF2586 domain-containing protein [Methylomagnum ishizawai]BBL73973.1 phage tail protein [Methylomagnum ishizawai]
MALGSVSVIAANQQQGEVAAIEKYFLFVGVGPSHQGELVFLNAQSDLDAELGSASSALKTQVAAAQLNGGQGWACIAAPIASTADWEDAVDLGTGYAKGVEAVAMCFPIAAQADITAYQSKAEAILAASGRRVFFIAPTAAIDPDAEEGQSWGDYIADLGDLTDGVLASRVMLCPLIFPDAVGILAGRLCRADVSIADSPMRVATGAILGRTLDDLPADKDGVVYGNAHALALNNARLTVPQTYADYEGVYWSDGQMLDAEGGDFQVVENLRVVDKAARRVRLILISMVADRRLNSSPESIAWATTRLSAPLREMAKSYVFQGIPFVADIEPPQEGDIAIQWVSRTEVRIYMVVRPFESPKTITAYIVLDLSAPA